MAGILFPPLHLKSLLIGKYKSKIKKQILSLSQYFLVYVLFLCHPSPDEHFDVVHGGLSEHGELSWGELVRMVANLELAPD